MEEFKKMDLRSMDITAEHKAKLKQIFPHVFNEDKIDFERLKQTLGEDVDAGLERFGLTWPGKAECMKIIQQPSIGTLKPCKEESVNFDTTENLFIEGDNLEVLKLLQKSYYGKVKMIYIDPPYNTGKEFIYPDKYSETLETYLAYTGQVDAEGKKFSTNTEADGRFHSKWINMMYPRLFLARNLLSGGGVIFVSIGKEELVNLRKIMEEIFGEENLIGIVSRVTKKGGNAGDFFAPSIDFIVCFGRNRNSADHFRETLGETDLNRIYTETDKDGPFYWRNFYESALELERSSNARYYIEAPDKTKIIPPEEHRWRRVEESFLEEKKAGIIKFEKTDNSPHIDEKGNKSNWHVFYKLRPKPYVPNDFIVFEENIQNSLGTLSLNELGIPFEFSKPPQLIEKLMSFSLEHGTQKDDLIILDFFAGSSSTAHAVLKMNCQNKNYKFIMVQLPEPCEENTSVSKEGYRTIADIGKERIRRVIKKIQNESKEQLDLQGNKIDLGFKVFKLDQSNFKIWDGEIEQTSDGKKIEKQLEFQIEHINPKATEEEILYELLLKSGFALTTKVEVLQMAGKRVYSIENGALLICLERNLTKEVITEMARKEPARVICLDVGFSGNDQLKTNAVQIMKSHKVEDFRTV